jgi:lysophospholipase L1-like esterase
MDRRRLPIVRWVLSLALVPVSVATAAEQQGGLKDRDVVAICGDSITEQKLYSVFMEDYLLMCKPAAGVRTVQVGWSGETSWGFLGRMKKDALSFGPTVATTCYGMNDGGYAKLTDEVAAKYRRAMTDVVKTFKEGGVRTIVVGSPGLVDPAYFPPAYIGKRFADLPPAEYSKVYNENLGQLREIARDVAKEQGVAFADVYGPMQDVMAEAKAKYGEKYHVAGGDGVHPAPNGHIVMAYAFLKALGCDGNIGTITVDMKGGTAEATEGHKVLSSSAGGGVEVESSRYPFCFYGDPKDPAATSGIIEFLPFNEELNRFVLVVKNAPERVRVTWGNGSKEFSREQAEKGINLAAEFIDNPFCEPFRKVEEAIKGQQMFETAVTKTVFHLKPADVGGREAGYQALTAGVMHQDDELAAASSAAVAPVRHTIKVEAVR